MVGPSILWASESGRRHGIAVRVARVNLSRCGWGAPEGCACGWCSQYAGDVEEAGRAWLSFADTGYYMGQDFERAYERALNGRVVELLAPYGRKGVA